MKNNIKVNINTIATLLTLFTFVVGGTLYFQKVLNKIENNTILIEQGTEDSNKNIYILGADAINYFKLSYDSKDLSEVENQINEPSNYVYTANLSTACDNLIVKDFMKYSYDHQLINDLCNAVK